MHLIIAEKNLVAERIAAFLANGKKVSATRDGVAVQYSFGDTTVMGLRGHVVEVDFVDGYKNWRSAERPPRSLINAGVVKNPTEKKIVSLMQRFAKKADRVTIATDFDTEGELIGKEAYELIRAANKNVLIDRARFSAVTKDEILSAITNAEPLDFNLAAAGESRQIIDLVWGASLTRFMSIAAHRGADSILSVGRVQSPTLSMIVDREREIEAFVPTKYWVLTLKGTRGTDVLEARHAHGKYENYDEAKAAYEATASPVKVENVTTKEKKLSAPAPLDTTALIVGAGRIGLSAAVAMNRAEELYMRGFISYPRTDNTTYPKSLNISEHLKIFEHGQFAKDVELVKKYQRAVPTRGKKETTDHPPIYPTSLATRAEIGDDQAWKLYEFVVRRFFATLCCDAEQEALSVALLAGSEPYVSTGTRILVSGWLSVYPYSKFEDLILPAVKAGDVFTLAKKNIDEKETKPPARYSQSALIQRMEEAGIGTKSTRHEIITKLINRKYIEGNPMRPTIVGRAMTESLETYAGTISRPQMTKTLEEHMSDIAAGTKTMDEVLAESRTMLSGIFDELEKNGESIGAKIMDNTLEEQTLGKCPVCGGQLRIHRTGMSQFIGCSNYPTCTFNIGLPPSVWGTAVKQDEVCPEHGLHHVFLIRRGAPPWKIGCPLCSHIKTNSETLKMLPEMTDEGIAKLNAAFIYTLSDVISLTPAALAGKLAISPADARKMHSDAEILMEQLKKRTELKKFISAHVPPRKGRGHAKIANVIFAKGIYDLAALAKADPGLLKDAKISENEAKNLIADAAAVVNHARMKDAGISTVTLKKYEAAGFTTPELFIAAHPAGVALATGVSVSTVCNHQEAVSAYLHVRVPEKISKQVFDDGLKALRTKITDEDMLINLGLAGVYSPESLAKADPEKMAACGIPKDKIAVLKAMKF
ncbi:MAG TPA: DNA topoisomerase I [Methanocorpusculum sp.]|nr:DNA topoisomerase I [Methanocorpusculum sp.]